MKIKKQKGPPTNRRKKNKNKKGKQRAGQDGCVRQLPWETRPNSSLTYSVNKLTGEIR